MKKAQDHIGVKLIECPRDAMQGWLNQIPTETKIEYLNLLLKVGFDTLDFGSFVSPKAIPQMADTAQVLSGLSVSSSKTKLLAIVVNEQGALEAVQSDAIRFLGYPFSISETFQQRNTNKSVKESLLLVQRIQELCNQHQKELVVYISMGFGNPYGDPYDKKIVAGWADTFSRMGIKIVSLADTVGVADPDTISYLYSHLIPAFPEVTFGAHFHTTAQNWESKIAAAYDSGCRRFDTALKGLGGCPMAEDKLVGNLATENMLHFCHKRKIPVSIRNNKFQKALRMAKEIFI